jgi:hypothetical protein
MQNDLTLRNVDYGSTESTWDLTPLLYVGGAATNIRQVYKSIEAGDLGTIQNQRLDLVIRVHETLSAKLAAGISRYTVRGKIIQLRSFYGWADKNNYQPDVSNITEKYVEWTEHLNYRLRIQKNLAAKSASSLASGIGSLLEEATGLTNILRRSRVRKTSSKKRVLGTSADKQLVSQTFELGRLLLKICETLTVENIQQRLPVIIMFEHGKKLEEWSGLKPEKEELNSETALKKPYYLKKVLDRRERWQADYSWKARYPLLNLRIEAEMLIFIAQTGINLAQAHKLKIDDFRYASHNDGYMVRRAYKSRSGGEVEFEIYSEYRTFFEKYIHWRKVFFPNGGDDRLFPLKSPKYQSVEVAPHFERIRDRCTLLGVKYYGPRELRKTRINWLIRKSQDIALVAEMAQHTQQTLLSVYEMPHHQLAAVEITKFNNEREKTFKAPGPGLCANEESRQPNSVIENSLEPNCVNPAGCLFCTYQRDIESFDHVWSLKTYQRYQIELLITQRSASDNREMNPVEITIARLTAKLSAFREKGGVHEEWVDESDARISEGDYHPQWEIFIKLLEIK